MNLECLYKQEHIKRRQTKKEKNIFISSCITEGIPPVNIKKYSESHGCTIQEAYTSIMSDKSKYIKYKLDADICNTCEMLDINPHEVIKYQTIYDCSVDHAIVLALDSKEGRGKYRDINKYFDIYKFITPW